MEMYLSDEWNSLRLRIYIVTLSLQEATSWLCKKEETVYTLPITRRSLGFLSQLPWLMYSFLQPL